VTALRVEFGAIGTTACVVAERPGDLVAARRALESEIERIDLACSRFRPDSDLARVHRSAGAPVPIGDALVEALQVAMHAAEVTGGLVDPTVGASVVALGYDRDFAAVEQRKHVGIPRDVLPRPLPVSSGWRAVELDVEARTVRVPPGTVLDLGATAKALAVDRAARAVQLACLGPVVVGIGGDLAVAGRPPDGGWSIRVADRHRGGEPAATAGDGRDPTSIACVALHDGALATSSTSVRRWRFAGRNCHHIVDPGTGLPAGGRWCTVSVAGATCVDANTASTAAIVMGDGARSWLAARRLPSRLVATDGTVTHVAGWPPEAEARAAA
jgi:thiamine biosynthesis lipoprotein